MGKHCLQLVVTLLPLMHGNFSNKLTRKIHAAQLVFSIIFKMVDTNACMLPMSAVQTSEPMSKTRGNTLLVLLLRIVYCIVTTVSGYLSYRGKMGLLKPQTCYLL